MGKKIHPIAFRLLHLPKFLSHWCVEKTHYAQFLNEDFVLRTKLTMVLQDFVVVSKIEINRFISIYTNKNTYVQINCFLFLLATQDIYTNCQTTFKTYLGVEGQDILTTTSVDFIFFMINQTIKRLISYFSVKFKKQYYVRLTFIYPFFSDIGLMLNYIQEQILQRVPFRQIIIKLIQETKKLKIEGIKIQLTGRITGQPRTRTEWQKMGKIPLHTLDAQIDYGQLSFCTRYGMAGIKLWLFLGFKK